MLRKFIYGNNATPSEPVKVPEKRPAELQREEFSLLVTRLDEYQGMDSGVLSPGHDINSQCLLRSCEERSKRALSPLPRAHRFSI